ncbi:MAG: LamG domain-containing protein, partial [Gemmatimonadetes bacterium]|nr:LamG domain-containing protein [Gemmatimonadota bacterium]
MRRSRLLLLPAIVFALFLTSCRDRSSPTKPGTEPSYGKYEGDQDAAAVRIQALIEALYPEPGLEKAALNIWSNIQRLVSRELTDAASDQARALAGHLSDAFSQDQLEAPDDPLLPPTIEGAMSELLTRLYAFVGLEPSEALESYPDMLPQDFGAGDIDPEEGGTIVTAHGWAAVIAGTGATAEPVHITIELLDDAACDDVGELVRAVGCWDINWYPEDEEFEGFTDDVKVEACVADNPDMSDPEWNALLLHHKSDDGEVTALPWAEPTVVDCDGFTGGAEEETASLGPLGSWFASVRSHVADLLMPEPLAARVPFFGRMPKGIGGTTGTFSEFFGAVSRDLGQVLPEPLWDNLISWWPGNGTFDDIYGESPGHDDPEGSISFGTPAISGWAFQFGQGAGKVWMDTLSNEIEALQKLTLATWVYLDPNGPADRIQRFVSLGNEQAVLRQDMGGNRMLHFYMGFDEDGLVLHHVWVDNVLQPGCYHLVAGTYDGQDMRVYLDGEEVGSEPV